jgi:hypothetical protein
VCVGGVVRLVSIVVIAWLARADLVPLHVDLALGRICGPRRASGPWEDLVRVSADLALGRI